MAGALETADFEASSLVSAGQQLFTIEATNGADDMLGATVTVDWINDLEPPGVRVANREIQQRDSEG